MRFPSLSATELSDEQRATAAEIVSGPRGQLRGPFLPLIYSPQLTSHVQKLGEYLRFQSSIPSHLLEIAVLLTARRFDCANIWESHRTLALKAGLSPAIISAIALRRRPDGVTDEQNAIFDFCDELALRNRISQQVFERIEGVFGKRGVMDLTAICGYYALLSMVLNVSEVELPAGSTPFEH